MGRSRSPTSVPVSGCVTGSRSQMTWGGCVEDGATGDTDGAMTKPAAVGSDRPMTCAANLWQELLMSASAIPAPFEIVPNDTSSAK